MFMWSFGSLLGALDCKIWKSVVRALAVLYNKRWSSTLSQAILSGIVSLDLSVKPTRREEGIPQFQPGAPCIGAIILGQIMWSFRIFQSPVLGSL